ncbi:MAG TPA: general secretion pathway protein GspB [Caldimonas sp.]|jgi:general secretion pathway protein B|nr:general secretion pathway protein GspB [Caldimonas sp.]HEX2539936.1 general secretion pathway protein GspB [Caldimonas sp.]
MSYILDALRRADAERERGEVPGLQSQQHALLPDDEAPARSRLLVWAVVGLSIALVAVLGWSLLGRESPPPRPIAEGTVAPPSPALPPPAPTVLPSTATAAPPALTGAASATAAAPAAPPPERRASTRAAAGTTAAAAASGADGRRAAGRPAPAASAARPAADTRIYAQAELPEAIRREMPKLSVGGASYSNDAASRMLIINGQIFHEGDRIAPGLELEKIRLRSAILSFKGYRYELSY